MKIVKDLYSFVYPDIFLSVKLSTYALFHELYHSGVPLQRCCELLAARIDDRRIRQVMQSILADLLNRRSFGDALSNQRSVLGDWDVNLLLAGERAGRLEEFLNLLKSHYERKVEQQRMIAASAMPSLITLLLFIFFFSIVDYFTGGFIGYLMATVVPLVIGIPVLAIGWAMLKRLTAIPPVKIMIDQLSLALPLIGPVKKEILTARFAESFALLISAGLDAAEVMSLAAESTGHAGMVSRTRLLIGQESLNQGWSSTLSQLPVLKREYIDALIIAEESGGLDRVSLDIARNCHVRAQKKLEMMLPIVTKMVVIPILVIFFFSKLWLAGIAFIKLFITRMQEIIAGRIPH
jgi:type II secretory pathway component PulF